MELIGKAAIHPLWFYSGKVCGYATWIITILAWFGAEYLGYMSRVRRYM